MLDGVLMLGFGGPTPGCCERRASCPRTPGCEAECFVSGILGDNPARSGRVAEVVGHYRRLGGFSPFNQLTRAQADALERELARRGRPLPVACGFRHWRPWAVDGVRELARRGCREAALLVMAPHQSSVSWDWYLSHAAEAVAAAGPGTLRLAGVVPPWWREPGFIAGIAAGIAAAVQGWGGRRFAEADLVFTAHAIPEPVALRAPYVRQFAETAALAAERCGHPAHRIAFQSQPADSAIPWTGPDILAAIDAVAADGGREVVLAAAGFLVDHTEVLYDLDVEAGARARSHGIAYTRATCVHDQPDFISMLAERILGL